eukprot:CAMPEP_0116034766 /NCGR_PEP_ID=MMETSP0321-20121206/19856_1 /TAXON_ID=163516 /ORGANISM="Leptocylindrus danicus var. danicus, Strain B650" /LENGTH=409 /DNA_ID=CAMNT_0003511247 /DNA_START=67 /DNA_END=1296 /DNA_ORIENTATION=-
MRRRSNRLLSAQNQLLGDGNGDGARSSPPLMPELDDAESSSLSENSKRRRSVTPSPKVAVKPLFLGTKKARNWDEEEVVVGPASNNCDHDSGGSIALPEGVINLDLPTNRLNCPVRSRAEDENTVFVQSYGEYFYNSLLQSSHHNEISKDDRYLSDEEREELVLLIAGIVTKRGLLQETLHLAVQILDRFFAQNLLDQWGNTYRSRVCVALSCYFAAHKIEERGFPPFIVDMTGGTGLLEYTEQDIDPQEILDMEMRICLALKFRLHKTTPCSFRDRFIQASFVGDGDAWPTIPSNKFISMVDYLLDVSLQSYDLISKSSSAIAASAIYLARKTLDLKDSHGLIWSPTLKHYTTYSANDMEGTVVELHKQQCATNNDIFNRFYKKYRGESKFCVALEAALHPEDLFQKH